jgi:hypothetical protein
MKLKGGVPDERLARAFRRITHFDLSAAGEMLISVYLCPFHRESLSPEENSFGKFTI